VAEWKPPSVTVAAVVEREGKFLLVEEEFDGRRVLNQPAGHLDPGEGLVAACVREVMEETAHHFQPEALVGIYRWFYAPRDITYLRFTFCGKVGAPVPGRKLDKEIVATHWLTRDEIVARRAEHRTELLLACLDDYLAGKRYPLDVLSPAYA
jgi:8-oxo-dGTP pyrophosphatase MutT (NUDIX family)